MWHTNSSPVSGVSPVTDPDHRIDNVTAYSDTIDDPERMARLHRTTPVTAEEENEFHDLLDAMGAAHDANTAAQEAANHGTPDEAAATAAAAEAAQNRLTAVVAAQERVDKQRPLR